MSEEDNKGTRSTSSGMIVGRGTLMYVYPIMQVGGHGAGQLVRHVSFTGVTKRFGSPKAGYIYASLSY